MRRHLVLSLRLYFRNKMALIYGYLFPVMYFVAFWVLYRFDRLPVARHMGELLTVSILAGACFGLPTTIVSERERGVWRRYRLTPVPVPSLIASAGIARYLILITAGLLQIALARVVGAPFPQHPLQLLVVYTIVSFAFIGVGLVIATLADNVPAVQALGQCIFLPMLIIGGIAVQLSTLPAWAQHVSAFFPGRYAVEALQSCVIGPGLSAARFDLLALVSIGVAGCLAGTMMFRWDAQQRFIAREGKGWLAVALAAWVAVGLATESRGAARVSLAGANVALEAVPVSAPAPSTFAPPAPVAPALARAPATNASAPPPLVSPTIPPAAAASAPKPDKGAPATPPGLNKPEKNTPPPAAGPPEPKTWQDVTLAQATDDIAFERLPPDGGVVTPVAPLDEVPDQDVLDQIDVMREALPEWAPGKVADPVQRVRNLLFVAAVPDVFQMPIERYAPQLVFDRLTDGMPKDQLIKILFWIALHPNDGDDSAVDNLKPLGLPNGRSDMMEARYRSMVYALKLLGRLVGKIKIK
jgi:ABC-2 type transporter